MAKHRRKKTGCPNCGTELSDRFEFCPTCGQENHDLRVPFGHLLYEFIEGIFHFDGKFWTTLRTLAVPGKLTEDYLAGKRARYVPPARLYIFVSIVFFFLLGKFTHRQMEALMQASEVRQRAAAMDTVRARSVADDPANMSMSMKRDSTGNPEGVELNLSVTEDARLFLKEHRDDLSRRELDSVLVSMGTEPSWFNRRWLVALAHLPEEERAIGQYLAGLFPKASWIMFILMPFAALLLKVVFDRKRLYHDHLIFSIHLQTASFLAGCISFLLALRWPDILVGDHAYLATLPFLIYTVFALKRVYRRSWPTTLFRSFLVGIPYYFTLMVLFVLGVLMGFFWH